MTLLATGLLLFLGVHLIPAAGDLRARLIAARGRHAYRALFALLSLAGFILIVMGYRRAGFTPLWEPPVWGHDVARLTMPLSLVLIAGAYLPGNVKRLTRHPMLWGVALWAASHLFANGDLASVTLFGAFGAYALFAMWSQNRRGAVRQTAARPLHLDVIVLAAGLAAYAAFGFGHRYFVGVPAFN